MNSPLFPRGGKTYSSAKLEAPEKRTFRDGQTGRRVDISFDCCSIVYSQL